MNKLYLIKRKDDLNTFDEVCGMVVSARYPREAREIATNYKNGDEDKSMWMDKELTTCEEIGTSSVERKIILVDFHEA